MQCKNKEVFVKGLKDCGRKGFKNKIFRVMITNDKNGKTLSISDGDTAFTLNAAEIAHWLE